MKRLVFTLSLILTCLSPTKAQIAGALQSYNDGKQDEARVQQYFPEGDAIVCVNGKNRFTRALYGSYTDWRLETSDRPVFAVVKKNHHRHIRFEVNGVALDSTDYCKASYVNGMRIYRLQDKRWGKDAYLKLSVVAMPIGKGLCGSLMISISTKKPFSVLRYAILPIPNSVVMVTLVPISQAASRLRPKREI
jgi:hypothetical protein